MPISACGNRHWLPQPISDDRLVRRFQHKVLRWRRNRVPYVVCGLDPGGDCVAVGREFLPLLPSLILSSRYMFFSFRKLLSGVGSTGSVKWTTGSLMLLTLTGLSFARSCVT